MGLGSRGMDASRAWPWARSNATEEPEPGSGIGLDAFGQLYQELLPRLYHYLRLRVGSDDEAIDLTQQVFVRALTALPRFEARGAPIEAWLFRIAANLVIDARRHQRVVVSWEQVPESEQPVDPTDLEADALRAEAIRQLPALLARLDDVQRELVLLRFIAGLSPKEIAVVLGKREGAVRRQLSRTLRRLKEYAHEQ